MITVGDLEKMITLLVSPSLQLDVTSMATIYLEGIPEESLFFQLTTKVSAWSLLDDTKIELFWQQTPKVRLA